MNNGRPPIFYQYEVIGNSAFDKPSTSHVRNTAIALYFKRHLLQRAMSPFKFTLPENWDKDYFLYCVYCWGYVGVFNTDKFGVIPQAGSLKGFNVFYRPTEFVVANPLLPFKTYNIGKDCELVKLTPDYLGIMDIVNYYGDILALTYEALDMNIANSKLAYVFACDSKKTSESLKKLFDNVQGGDLAAFYDKDLKIEEGHKPWEVFEQNLKNNFIAENILVVWRDIINQFDTEVGIDNNNLSKKKERVTTAEVESNDEEIYTKVDLWFETIKQGFEKVNTMFYNGDEECKIEWRGGEPFNAKNDSEPTDILLGQKNTI